MVWIRFEKRILDRSFQEYTEGILRFSYSRIMKGFQIYSVIHEISEVEQNYQVRAQV